MTPDQLRSALRAAPFVPFRIHLVDQRTFDVPHSEFAAMNASGRVAHVFAHDREVAEVIDVALIVSLSPIDGNPSRAQAA
ncbi:MAG: hypothetical protein FGM39_08690 [Phycisphaerales bacterium]|nr:hypothetical protein [Phycisphaerales bacterium]